jgi:spore maturation protein CgeB
MPSSPRPPPDLLARLPKRTGGVLRILYVGDLRDGGTSRQRLEALRRLGHRVDCLDPNAIALGRGRLADWLTLRLTSGPGVDAVNKAVLDRATAGGVDLVWFDKALLVRRETVRAIASLDVIAVHYTSDLPFVDRGDPGRRLLKATVSDYHHCVVPSPEHVPFYERAGCRSVLHMPVGFDPLTHFPPPPGWTPAEEKTPVGFVGTPYGDRARFLVRLAREHGINVAIHGGLWDKALSRRDRAMLRPMPERTGGAYRETLWGSDICLGFVTHAMRHDEARRWVEIAACGGFLLAESPRQRSRLFRPGRDAVFFSTVEDCATEIRHYLADPAARQRVAEAGHAAVWPDRSNDALLNRVLTAVGGGALDPPAADS